MQSADGRSLSIEVGSVDGHSVTFTVAGKPQNFTLPLERFDEASREKIKAATLGAKVFYPPLEIDAVIGKRRVKEGYYMVNQTITATVKLKNLSTTDGCPKAHAHVIFIGFDRKVDTKGMVLAAESFDFALPRGVSQEFECTSFTTSYDSDNKGDGNIGGYQYKDYIIILTGADGNVLQCKSSNSVWQATLSQDKARAKKATMLKKLTPVTEKLDSI